MFTHDKVRFDKTHNIHLVLSLKAPKLDWETKRPPVCIIPIIDVSGSMAGEKLDYAKKTLLKLVDHLKPGDYCGLGAFATEIHEIQAPVEMTQTSKDALKNRIGDLHTTSSTNFSGGLELGLKWGSKVDIGKEMLVRVIMLTDGCANHGVTSSEGLAKIVDTRGKTTVSCFGYGTDANQELLADLAKRGEGNYAFIKHPDEALSAFGKELGGLLSTYAQGLVLDLAPHNGHKIAEVISDVDVDEKDGRVVIKLGDLLSEEERHVVIATTLSAQTQALPREMNIVDVKIDYDLIVDGKREHRQEELKAKLRFVKEGEEQEKPTQAVDQIVGLAQVGQAQIKAEECAKNGDFQGAVARMDAMETSLNSRGHDKLGAFAKGIRSKVVSQSSYTSSQGYLRSSKGYAARGMSVSKMDGDLEREIVSSGLGADFAMSNSAQCSTAGSFAGEADPHVEKGRNNLASIAGSLMIPGLLMIPGTLPPAAPVAAGAAKAEKEKPKKGVSKSKSNRW
jgi:Ca-activated chloride channel family protein